MVLSGALAFFVPGLIGVAVFDEPLDRGLLSGIPVRCVALPAGIFFKRGPKRLRHFLGGKGFARELQDSGKLRRMLALGQQNAAVLHEALPLFALGAADDLSAFAQDVSGRVMLKAKDCAVTRLLLDETDLARKAKSLESADDDPVHPRHPFLIAGPWAGQRDRQAIGQLMMVNESAAAGGATHEGKRFETLLKPGLGGLKVAEADGRLVPLVKP